MTKEAKKKAAKASPSKAQPKKAAAPTKEAAAAKAARPEAPRPPAPRPQPQPEPFRPLLEPDATAIRAKIVLRHEEVLRGSAEAVVIPANTDLILGSGLAASARRKGGDVIQKECKRIGSIALGQAVVTTGGKLRCKFLVHAACIGLGQKTTEKELMDAMQNALKRGTEKACKTIAFPAMGITHEDFPVKRCAEIMISEVQKYLDGSVNYESIFFCIPDPLHFRAFEASLKELQE